MVFTYYVLLQEYDRRWNFCPISPIMRRNNIGVTNRIKWRKISDSL
jgi:hypothetical protein